MNLLIYSPRPKAINDEKMRHKLIVEIDIENDDLMTEVVHSLAQHCNVVSVEQPLQGKSIDELIPSDKHPKITIGSYSIQQMPNNPQKVWIEDTITGEAGEFSGVGLHYAIHRFYKGNF